MVAVSKDSVDDYLQTCIAMDTPTVLYPSMAEEIQSLIESAPCPVCNTNCSGCLEDLAAKQEGLRELLSYCRTKADGPTIDGIYGHNEVYDEIANRLTPLLDGEQ